MTDIIDANNLAFLTALAKKQGSALDKIAERLALDEDGVWSDETDILESIGYTIMATGRKIEGWAS